MTRRQISVAVLLLAGLALLAVWFLRHYELRRIDVPLPPAGEARDNPLFAAEHYLRRLDTPAASASLPELLRQPPEPGSVIIIDSNRYTLDPRADQRLLDWARDGGNLILRPGYRGPTDEDAALSDPLLDRLGIKVMPVENIVSEKPIEWTPPGRDSPLYIEDYSFTRLTGYRPDDRLGRSPNGVQLVQRRLGRGLVTIATDLRFLDNEHIGERDHALALWHLTHQLGQPHAVYLAHSERPAPLPTLLWRHFRPVIIAAGLLLALWLTAGLRRFGPLLPEPAPASRSLLEHIDASGHYFWRHGMAGQLVARCRQTLDEQLERHHPGWARLDPATREARLAEMTGWPPEKIRAALTDQTIADRDSFTRMIQQIETLRRSI